MAHTSWPDRRPLGATIYHDDINHRAFIDLLRPLRGKPILDLDFLVDDVMGSKSRSTRRA